MADEKDPPHHRWMIALVFPASVIVFFLSGLRDFLSENLGLEPFLVVVCLVAVCAMGAMAIVLMRRDIDVFIDHLLTVLDRRKSVILATMFLLFTGGVVFVVARRNHTPETIAAPPIPEPSDENDIVDQVDGELARLLNSSNQPNRKRRDVFHYSKATFYIQYLEDATRVGWWGVVTSTADDKYRLGFVPEGPLVELTSRTSKYARYWCRQVGTDKWEEKPVERDGEFGTTEHGSAFVVEDLYPANHTQGDFEVRVMLYSPASFWDDVDLEVLNLSRFAELKRININITGRPTLRTQMIRIWPDGSGGHDFCFFDPDVSETLFGRSGPRGGRRLAGSALSEKLAMYDWWPTDDEERLFQHIGPRGVAIRTEFQVHPDTMIYGLIAEGR